MLFASTAVWTAAGSTLPACGFACIDASRSAMRGGRADVRLAMESSNLSTGGSAVMRGGFLALVSCARALPVLASGVSGTTTVATLQRAGVLSS